MFRGSSVRAIPDTGISLFSLEAFCPGFFSLSLGTPDGSAAEDEHRNASPLHTQETN